MGARCDGVGVELDTHGRLCGSAQSTDRELREKDTNQKITQVRSCLLVTWNGWRDSKRRGWPHYPQLTSLRGKTSLTHDCTCNFLLLRGHVLLLAKQARRTKGPADNATPVVLSAVPTGSANIFHFSRQHAIRCQCHRHPPSSSWQKQQVFRAKRYTWGIVLTRLRVQQALYLQATYAQRFKRWFQYAQGV